MKELTCEKYETCETPAAQLFGFSDFNECFELLEIEEENKNDDCEFNEQRQSLFGAILKPRMRQILSNGFPAVCEILYSCNEEVEELIKILMMTNHGGLRQIVFPTQLPVVRHRSVYVVFLLWWDHLTNIHMDHSILNDPRVLVFGFKSATETNGNN